MTSSEREQGRMLTEQNNLSLKRRQLLERKQILCVFQKFRNRVEFGQTEEAASAQQEIDSIDDKLRELSEKEAELQNSHDTILSADYKENHVEKVTLNTTSQMIPPIEPTSAINVFYVEAPPSSPAPKVILDTGHLPSYPSRTQCPDCRQYVVTETTTSVSSVTWMVCFMTAMLGCVAGCCLLPFCLDKFKSTSHKCPKCRTLIATNKKL
ncbi:lipopolysaccharide-induced tumor necrosis factor-alpha factor-like [Paralichthys olivaceus]|uniref:lipopolysaccharide-induced tumor necrosis factor-alpha factor-like n=1 Tax=Paralichthys olivaceus TaxID=8255 RepID=UPI0037520C99